MKSQEVTSFSTQHVQPLLASDFEVYSKRDLVRMRGPFVQAVLFSIKRSGWLHIVPTFYVVGADPTQDVLFQTMHLPITGVDERGSWRVRADELLDQKLAQRIARQLESESPISYMKELDDSSVRKTLTLFREKCPHWMPGLSLAFWDIVSGANLAHDSISKGMKLFLRHSRYGAGEPPLEYEIGLKHRFDVLQSRLESVEGRSVCRSDAEEHARVLGLPIIDWPLEWL